MVAINLETGERKHGTVTSETRRIFENLKLLLEPAGSSLDRIVQVHAMIYERIEYHVLNRAYRPYVPNAPPARTIMSDASRGPPNCRARCGAIRRNRAPRPTVAVSVGDYPTRASMLH
jgi:hypothetical protein